MSGASGSMKRTTKIFLAVAALVTAACGYWA